MMSVWNWCFADKKDRSVGKDEIHYGTFEQSEGRKLGIGYRLQSSKSIMA